MSCSTVSTSSVDEAGRPQPHDTSIDHSAAASFRGSTPSSPSPEVIGQQHPGSTSEPPTKLSRPPGLGGHAASPTVGAAGHHSKNSSVTSPMLTLTPNSSVDGNSDIYSLGGGRQQSPFQGGEGGPTMPFLRNDGRRGDENGEYGGTLSNFGSFDLADNDNDGLLGLDALRDRAYSSPGPMARSFESAPSLRGGLPPSRGDAGSEGRRRRGVSRDNSGRSAGSARPPLAGGNNSSSHSPRADIGPSGSSGGDLSLGGLVVPFHPSGGRSGDPSPTRQTQEDLRGFGAIGRPEFSGAAQEWEPSTNRRRSIAGMESSVIPRPEYRGHGDQETGYNTSRRRSIGTESGREFYHHQQHQHHNNHGNHYGSHGDSGMGQGLSDQAIAHKFGQLPSLGSHLQQKRMPGQYQGQSQGHHQSHQQPYNPSMIPQPKHQRSYSQPGPNRNAPPPDHYGADGGHGRYPPEGLETSSSHYPRDPPRYIGAPPPHHARTHSGDSFRSGHSRRSASMSHGSLSNGSYEGGGMLTKRNSQPNLGSGYYGQSQSQALPSMHPSMQRMKDELFEAQHQRRHPYEDDLTLLGEHIEVPADHAGDDGGFGHGYGVSDRMRPQMATPEAMAPHYSGYEGQHIHHLPTAGAALPSPKVVFNVKFKRTQRSFVLGPRIQRDLKVGTYVKVEADRGEDLGIVIGKVPAEKYSFSGRNAYRSQSMSGIDSLMPSPNGLSPPGATDLKCIIRLATHDEVSLLSMKREEEEELLKICRTKVRQRGLPMNVVDAEYQFDRHKLTFFFEAEGRIDFRELVRDLFSMYKTRIWMQQLDKNVTTAGGTAMPPPPSTMIDYGTPIIAPASEFNDTYAMNGLANGS